MKPSKLSSARSPIMDSMKIDAQKRAAREGFDMDIIPTDIATYAGEAKNILRDLQSRNERMFLMTFLVVNCGGQQSKSWRTTYLPGCTLWRRNTTAHLVRLDFQQEQAASCRRCRWASTESGYERGLTTSAVAIFVPFTTQETFPRAARRCITG